MERRIDTLSGCREEDEGLNAAWGDKKGLAPLDEFEFRKFGDEELHEQSARRKGRLRDVGLECVNSRM